MTIQERNQELVDLLSADLQPRNEPNFAFKSCVSLFQAIPGLRGLWTMSSVKETAADRATDLSGQGNHLTENVSAGRISFGREALSLLPVADFNSANSQYLNRADAGATDWADITGTEAYVFAAQRGLTLGGWFRTDTLGAAQMGLISKWAGAGNRSYELQLTAGDVFGFQVSDDGTNSDLATSTAVLTAGNWYFAVGRFDPAALVEIYVNGAWDTQATARAAAFDSGQSFTIGARSSGAIFFDGRASLCFLSAALVSDAIITTLFEYSRRMVNI